MPFFPRNKDAAKLKAEIARLNSALEQQDRRTADVEAALAERALPTMPSGGVDAFAAPPPAESPRQAAETAPAVDPAEVERALSLATSLTARLDQVAAQLSDLDTRVTMVSRELANQLSELGNDIDALAQRPDGAPVDEEVLEELRDSQLRLANEQARYQIAFRSDLARLAEQMRRPPAR